MNTDSPRRRRPRYHPYDELSPSRLSLLLNLRSLEKRLAEKSRNISASHAPAGLLKDADPAAESGAVQHSEGDPAVAADADATPSHTPDQPHAAESNSLQHPENDFSDDEPADAAESNDLQHSENEFSEDDSGDRAECNTVQHPAVQPSPSAPGNAEPDAAESSDLQHAESASAENLPAAIEFNIERRESKLLADPAIAAEIKNVQRLAQEFRSQILELHESYRTPYSTPPVTSRQQTAIELLVAGATDTQAAKAIGVDRTTIWRWKKDRIFQAAFDLARELTFGETVDRLRAIAPHAVESLKEHVRSGDQMAAVRLLRLIRVDQWGLGKPHRQPADGGPLPLE